MCSKWILLYYRLIGNHLLYWHSISRIEQVGNLTWSWGQLCLCRSIGVSSSIPWLIHQLLHTSRDELHICKNWCQSQSLVVFCAPMHNNQSSWVTMYLCIPYRTDPWISHRSIRSSWSEHRDQKLINLNSLTIQWSVMFLPFSAYEGWPHVLQRAAQTKQL